MTTIRITDQTTRSELAEAIAALRTKAKRYSVTDRRRTEIDAKVDALVDRWMAAGS